MAHSELPGFGNWDAEVSYSEVFDKARKGKGGRMMNPNDPEDSLGKSPKHTHPVQAPFQQETEVKGRIETEAVRPKHERQRSGDDGELRGLADSPWLHDAKGQRPAGGSSHLHHGGLRSGNGKLESEASKHLDATRPKHERRFSPEEGDLRRLTDSPLQQETTGQRASIGSPYHRHGATSAGETPKRNARQSAGSDRSFDHSPLHPHYQTKTGGKGSGVSSPAYERKGSSEVSHALAPSTPGRSRLRAVTRGDDTPDHGAMVPKFGDWDESDPAAAEGFTQVFNRVREERQIGAGRVPITATEASHSNGQQQHGNDNSKKCCCCFPWGGK